MNCSLLAGWGVIAAYRRCERRLGELGTVPSSSTRQLLETLRR